MKRTRLIFLFVLFAWALGLLPIAHRLSPIATLQAQPVVEVPAGHETDTTGQYARLPYVMTARRAAVLDGVAATDIDEASELDALNIVTKNSTQTISGQKTFSVIPKLESTDLGDASTAGTTLTANTRYLLTLDAAYSCTFTLAANEALVIEMDSDGTHTFTFPQAYRSGDTTQPTSLSVPLGKYRFVFTTDANSVLRVSDDLPASQVAARVTTITSSATPTINTDSCDAVTITALATAITSMTTNLSGSPANFDQLIFRIKDDGTGRAITWGASFAARGASLPTTTTASKVLTVLFIYNSVTSTWDCISKAEES